MKICESFASPPPLEADFYQRNEGPDRGLINAWLAGIAMRQEQPAVAQRAMAGELPVLAFRGGVAKALKTRKPKLGALLYWAMWTGLRGEDLQVDTEDEPTLRCALHGVQVVYTHALHKLLEAPDEPADAE